MRKFALLVAAALLAGCAAQVLSSSERTVVVDARGPSAAAEAQKLADAECAKRQLHARLINWPRDAAFVYDCVQ